MEKKKHKIKKYVVIFIILAILVAGYFYVKTNAQKVAKDLAKSYVIENKAEIGNVEIKVTGSGVIQANRRAEVYASVPGEVTKINYEEGESIKKDGNICVVGGYNVKSPIAGTVITINVNKNDYVTNQTTTGNVKPVAVVADVSKMKVNLEVDELDINKIQLGMASNITCEATGNKIYQGSVTKIASEGKSLNGVTTYDVTIEMENPQDLKIGMNVDISLIVENKENVLRIPMDSINKSGEESYVYIKDESISQEELEKQNISSFKTPNSMQEVAGYKKQVVTTGINNKDYIEVTSGLSEGEKVYSISNAKSLTEYMMSGHETMAQ